MTETSIHPGARRTIRNTGYSKWNAAAPYRKLAGGEVTAESAPNTASGKCNPAA
jgi:hypothetical protein